ncbi:EscU/YscU/HrcU family type III secretion system export apparatus switch protein [Lederbergia lenta]|uniref:Flagellar biosynthesis pathway n=1 Tax=Lederbergia lenta TaxID=1467 RepID=A0A2X4WC30_LEDLE|nr:EscU/YscU/HrcU family type III secretion system export apparatus switch protein [Lederbergia lenta]MCM3110169.1 EscU/YscU/HrcU family type III secretion system export apparatus switch protein [Lederbergia lenta]MEC2324263.1 EscU/YscU/HrcU family type III secretion system export apparatus switch protein [Lederbergia lenta]SQI60249.1 flagellar biosynthesis pathway [Lederbergia lenta]
MRHKKIQIDNSKIEAIALKYQQGTQEAPMVIAKGKGIVAENILEKAKENEIPIQQDSTLVGLLSQLNMNETIPEELYKAVAEVFAFVYRLDRNQNS